MVFTILHILVLVMLLNIIHSFHINSIKPTVCNSYNIYSSNLFPKQLKLYTAKLNVNTDLNENNINYSQSIKRTVGWVSAAGLFATFVGMYKGLPAAIEFCSGYILEQCLSVDNLFVILVIFNYFGIERKNQEKPLTYGIIGAIVLRGIFIGLGSVILQSFQQILLLFASVLLFSSYKILFSNDDDSEEDLSTNPIIKFANKFLQTTDKLDGDNFFTVVNGVRMATPLLLCTLCIELSDVVFAFDSVPAVFGVTQDPLIVFSSNIFAVAGLRSLFGVLSQAVADLEYLDKSVGIILGIIALKMGFETFHIELLNPLQSLILVITILGAGVGLSLMKTQNTVKVEE